ncbi:6663_t:CDS:2, partial [Gigaspora rosea]
KAEIQEADCITGSDHEFILAEIELSEFLKVNTAARNRKKKYMRKVYEYGKARREDWESFRSDLQQTIEKKPSIKYLEGQEVSHDSKQLINKVWDAISDSIRYAANKNISYKKISNTVASKSAKKLRLQLHQERDVQEKINWTIQEINERLGTLIPHVESIVKDEHVEEAVDAWCAKIVKEQKKILVSLLEKPFKNVQIDRLLIEKDRECRLVSDVDE